MEDFLVTVEENGGYCLPYLSYWTTDGDFIDGFQLGDIANTPTGEASARVLRLPQPEHRARARQRHQRVRDRR
ncbi:MAG: hypothetical protein IPM46_16335 [Flavobacteriales bacterium]|nr:hypothetical protein [Flavobacteriales bacterium]